MKIGKSAITFKTFQFYVWISILYKFLNFDFKYFKFDFIF